MRQIFSFVLLSVLFVSCHTPKKDYSKELITDHTSTEDALEIAIFRGGPEIKKALRLVTYRKKHVASKDFLVGKLLSQKEALSFSRKANVLNLLQSFRLEPSEAILLFETLKASLEEKQHELAWGIATAFPSDSLSVHIEKHLSQALLYDDLERELVPSMADALARNNLVSSYSILKQGLIKTHDRAFSEAMIKLDPDSAEKDFINYLATVPFEELRQLNLQHSNVFLCLDILSFLYKRNPAPTHPNYEHLFSFAVSRNQSLSAYAIKIIEKAAQDHRSYLAQMLARTPVKIQLAYIEKVIRTESNQTRPFLKELKGLSSKRIVLKEIEDYLR